MRIVDPKCIVGIRQYNEAVPLRQRVMADSANLLPYFFFFIAFDLLCEPRVVLIQADFVVFNSLIFCGFIIRYQACVS